MYKHIEDDAAAWKALLRGESQLEFITESLDRHFLVDRRDLFKLLFFCAASYVRQAGGLRY
jgi:hypothetical protein